MTAERKWKPRSEWRRRVDDVLADGEWHPKRELLQAGSRFVPPGKAYRTGMAARAHLIKYSRKRGEKPGQPRGTDEEAIASGGREVVRKVVDAAIRRGDYEQRKIDGVMHVRTNEMRNT